MGESCYYVLCLYIGCGMRALRCQVLGRQLRTCNSAGSFSRVVAIAGRISSLWQTISSPDVRKDVSASDVFELSSIRELQDVCARKNKRRKTHLGKMTAKPRYAGRG